MKQGTRVKTIPMMTGEEREGTVVRIFEQEYWGDEESPIKTRLQGAAVAWDDGKESYCSADEIEVISESR
jgi:hypothetical protein|tara:strand:+ start:920 stop:1129 length:210 start_codon:yes stop_codon:yes gene_type:complete